MNTVLLTQRYRFAEARMFIAVEHRPHLVIAFERIPFPASWASEFTEMCDGSFGDGIRNPNSPNDFHADQCAGTRLLEGTEIGGFRVPAFAQQDEP